MKKVAVITGASRGIGFVTSQRLLEQAFVVYGISRSRPDIEDENFIWIQLDLTDTDAIAELASKIKEDYVDVLVNNAGDAFEMRALEDFSKRNRALIDLNLQAPILVTNTLKEKLNGSLVINISSVSDRIPGEGYALYCATKAALNIYFDVVAIEHSEMKIISLLPDYVDTPLLHRLQDGHMDFDWDEPIAAPDIASLICTIIEDNSQFVSGSRIIVVNDALEEDLHYKESLWGYNTDKKTFVKLT